MNKQAETIADLFFAWQDGRKYRGRVISDIMQRAGESNVFYVEFADKKGVWNGFAPHEVLDTVHPPDPAYVALLAAARALVDGLPASRVWTKEEIALVHAVAALTDPEQLTPYIRLITVRDSESAAPVEPIGEKPNPNQAGVKLTKKQALALGFVVRAYGMIDREKGAVERWYLRHNGNVYANGVRIENATFNQIGDHFDCLSPTRDQAWDYLPMIDPVTGAIVDPL